MAALTDGTQDGTIESSPVTPAPVESNTSTQPTDVNPITGTTTTQTPAPKPVTTVTSKTASDLVADKIQPTLATATNDITANNTKNATTALAPDDSSNKFNTATGQANPKYVAPTNITTTPPPEAPNPGFKYAYNPVSGAQTQIPTEDNASDYGLSDTNPKLGPSTRTSGSGITDSQGNTYQAYADGTYGKFNAAGDYVGPVSGNEFQNAQHASDLLGSLSSLANGSYPLTADQQAQVSALQATYQGLIKEQEIANENLTGGTTTAMNLYGMGNSVAGLGIIKGTVDSGIAKIADLNNKLVAAVAQMKSGFQTDNFNLVKGAYDAYNQAAKDKQTELDNLTTQAAAADAAMRDAKQKKQQYTLDVQKFQDTKDQEAFDNAFKTEQEAFDEKYKSDTLALQRFQAGYGIDGNNPGGISASADMGADGAPDPASQKQVLDQITQKYGPMTATAIKGLANYDLNPTDWSTRSAKGMSREQAVTLAKMYDPTYNDSQFPARSAYKKGLVSTANGTVGGAINAANKTINHLTAYLTTVSQLGNGASETVNSLLNPIEGLDQGRKQLMTAADTEGQGVADEMTKFFSQSQGDVKQVEAWKGKMNSNTTPGGQKGLAQGAIDLLAGQLQTLSEQYTATMGKAPPGNLLGTAAMASLSKLKNEGYTVDIPGVLYTDKDAYVKNDPAAVANMQSATKQLQDAGLPLTPDNILQLAQNQ